MSRRIHELTRRVITRLVEDAVAESERRLAGAVPGSVEAIRLLSAPVVAFSMAMAATDRALKAHLFPMLYHHPRLMVVRRDAEAIVRDLFARLTAEPALLPEDWRADLAGAAEPRLARRVGDYIAGMTDRYAVLEHRRLFPSTPDLRIPSP
jgi:dGTPase